MAQRKAQIQFVVDASGAIKPMVQVGDELKDISELSERTQKDLNKTFGTAAKAGKKVAAGTKQASSGMKSLTGSSNTANQTLFQFGQIAEDSAFGIRGVANNIPMAVQGFQRLSQQTGGAAGATKTLLGALTGPAGVLFAIQGLSTLALVAGPRLKQMFTGAAKEAKEFRDAAKSAFDDVLEFQHEGETFILEPDQIDNEIEKVEKLIGTYERSSDNIKTLGGQIAAVKRAMKEVNDESAREDLQKRLAGLQETRTAHQAYLSWLEDKRDDLHAQEAARQVAAERGTLKRKEGEEEVNIPIKARLQMLQSWSEHLTRTLPQVEQMGEAMQPDLPDDPVQEQVDSFDQLILKLGEFQRIQEAGLIEGQQAAMREVQILTQGLMQLIREGIDPASEEFRALMDQLRQAQTEVESFEDNAEQSSNTLSHTLVPAVQATGSLMAQAFDDADNSAERFRKTLASIIQSLGSRLLMMALQAGSGGLGLGALGVAASIGGNLLGMSHGGRVRGPGGPTDDRIPALLSNGEHVINARSTSAAPNLTRAINQSPAFASQMEQRAGLSGGPPQVTMNPNIGMDPLVSEIRSLREAIAEQPPPVVRMQEFHEKLDRYEKHVNYTNG